MAVASVEKWLDRGWSPLRIGYALLSALLTVSGALTYVKERHHPGAIWYLVGALAVVILYLAIEVLRWRTKHHRLALKQRTIESISPKDDPPPVIVLTKGVAGTNGFLQEFSSPLDGGYGFGYIRVDSQINVAARHDNPASIHIMKIIATFQFDKDEPFERETEIFEWYDATHRGEIRPDSGPVIVSPGRALRVATSFIITARDAVDGVDDPGARCHLPASAKISELTAVDAFGEAYLLAEEVPFHVLRLPTIQS